MNDTQRTIRQMADTLQNTLGDGLSLASEFREIEKAMQAAYSAGAEQMREDFAPPCLKCGDTLATVQHGNKQGLICMSCRDVSPSAIFLRRAWMHIALRCMSPCSHQGFFGGRCIQDASQYPLTWGELRDVANLIGKLIPEQAEGK